MTVRGPVPSAAVMVALYGEGEGGQDNGPGRPGPPPSAQGAQLEWKEQGLESDSRFRPSSALLLWALGRWFLSSESQVRGL